MARRPRPYADDPKAPHPDPAPPDPKRMDRARAKAGLLVAKVIREERRERERQQTRRIADLAKPDAGMRHRADMGAPLAIERGAVEAQREALIPLEPDRDRSQHQIGAQARRVWAPDRLIRGASPAIDQAQHDSASRLLTDFLIGVEAARPGDAGVRVWIDPWDRLPFSEQRAMRRQSFERAMRAAGMRFSPVLVWCVLQITPSPELAPTVERWGESVGMRTERAVVWFSAALEVLALHYGYRQRRDGGVDLAALGIGDGA